MRKLLLLLCLFPFAVHAGFEDGVSAYDKGDYATAMKEFTQAAQHGDVRALGKLGGMYLYGVGTAKDMVMAYVWFDLAASVGDAGAAKFRDAAAVQLTTPQLREASKLAEEYYDQYILPYKD